MKDLFAIAIILTCSSILSSGATWADDAESRKIIWIEKGKDAVRAKLKDPKSAEFRKVFFNRANLNGKSIPVSCGEVNAKNSFGGYSGFQRYVSGGSAGLTFLENQVDGFEKVWRQLCT